MGGLLVGITVLALANMATAELADPVHLFKVAASSEVIGSILLTFGAGASAVLLLILFGTPLAYVLARSRPSRFKGVVESIVDIPLILPHTVAGLLVYLLFMRRGWLGAPLSEVGLAFEDALPGTIVAMLFVASPFYVNTMREGFEKVPVHLENVARTLGAGTFTTFRTVTLPLSLRHMYSGAVLAWGRAIGEFAGVIMIAYYPFIISTLIYYSFTTDGIHTSRSIAFTVILVSFGVFYLLRRMTRYLGRYDDRV
ncbi:molybdenum ABC transporter permease [Methanoculleus sediminis]|uniref:Molybdenum ABC transporter permease n=2 Tax=Methanoculleus sediminis TaxID=1550566 RepID=A0A0H1R0Y4_9EURY|nr:molybdenum ABC transporter permease [Methanoculleus sediminis]